MWKAVLGPICIITSVGGCSLTSADVDRAIDISAAVCRVTPAVRAAAAIAGIAIPPKVSTIRGEACRRIATLAEGAR